MSVNFTMIVPDTSVLPEIQEAMNGSGVDYKLLESRWCGPYSNERSRALCVVEVESQKLAKTFRDAVGCQYSGIPDTYYAIGNTRLSEMRAKRNKPERIDHGIFYSKKPGPAKIRVQGMKGRYF